MTCRRIHTLSSIEGASGTLGQIYSNNINNASTIHTSSIYASNGWINRVDSSNHHISDSTLYLAGTKSYQVEYSTPYLTSDAHFFYSGYSPAIEGNLSDNLGRKTFLSSDGKTFAASSHSFNGGNGLVRVFNFNGGAWQKIGQDIVGSAGEGLGKSISLNSDGTILAVGSSNFGTNAGQVKIYDLNLNSWVLRSSIAGNPSDHFGSSISLSSDGDYIVVGASEANSNAGLAKVYEWNSNSWTEMSNGAQGSSPNDQFGFSVGIDDDGQDICVGAPGYNAGDGAVFNYNYSGAFSTASIGGLTFRSESMAASYNGLFVSVEQIPGGTNQPDPPKPATALYDSLSDTLLISADINNGSATNIDISGDLQSASNQAQLNSAGFSIIIPEGSGSNIAVTGGPIESDGGLDKFWKQRAGAILGSNSESFGSQVKMNSSLTMTACGPNGNQGNGSIRSYSHYIDSVSEFWRVRYPEISGKVFDSNQYGNIIAAGHPQANSNSGLCRVHGYHGAEWENIGHDLLGSTTNEEFGGSVSLDLNADVLCVSSINYGSNNGLVKPYDFHYISDININSKRITSSTLNLEYYKIPSYDTLNVGEVWRDENDNLKISSGWTPKIIATSLSAWFDGAAAWTLTQNGGLISQWDSRVGLASLTQPSLSDQPFFSSTNNLGSVNFSSSSSINMDSSLLTQSAPSCIILLAYVNSVFNGDPAFEFFDTSTGSASTRFTLTFNPTNNAFALRTEQNNSGIKQIIHQPSLNVSDSILMFTCFIDGANSFFSINGGSELSFGTLDSSGVILNGLNIGSNSNNVRGLPGQISELIVFNTAPSTEELEKTEGYLSCKWGLSNALRPNHPYKNTCPS